MDCVHIVAGGQERNREAPKSYGGTSRYKSGALICVCQYEKAELLPRHGASRGERNPSEAVVMYETDAGKIDEAKLVI